MRRYICIILALLILGCIGGKKPQVDDEPYCEGLFISYQDSCCYDENQDKVCDRFENETMQINCLKNAGFNPNKIYYIYNSGCGTQYQDIIDVVGKNDNVSFAKINVGVLDNKEIDLLECFYGTYYDGNVEFKVCPRLICPRNGKTRDLIVQRTVLEDAHDFVVRCKG